MDREPDTRDHTKRAYDKGCMWHMSGRDESQRPLRAGRGPGGLVARWLVRRA